MEHTKLISQSSGHYQCVSFSSKNMVNIAFFLSTEVGCPATTWQDWIIDDNKGLETSGNRMILEKEGDNIYLSDHYESKKKKTKFKVSRQSLIHLLDDWKKKVCTKMPAEVTITYENGTFTLKTSGDSCTHKKTIYTILFLLLISMGVFFAGIIFYATPIFKPFPKPSGQYPVGTTTMELHDTANNATAKRSLMIRFFYPAQPSEKKYLYLSDKISHLVPLIAQEFSCPQWLAQKMLSNIPTHTYENALLATTKTKYPVIVFSHGLLGLPSDMYHAYLENLASNGYIVAAIDHPYFNLLTVYPDHTTINSQKLTANFQTMNIFEQKNFQSEAIDTYKADISYILNQLTLLNENKNNIFYQHLDLNRIGIMGHSAGGTAAIELSRITSRIKACINLDGWYDHIIGQEPIQQPLLLLFGSKSIEITKPTAEYLKRKEISQEQYYQREYAIANHREALCKKPYCKMITIPNISHEDFSDKVLLKWPLRGWNEPDSYLTIKTINNYILEFYNTYLK